MARGRRKYGSSSRRSGGSKGGGGKSMSGKSMLMLAGAAVGGYFLYEKMNGSLGAAHAVQTAKVQAANPNLSQGQAAIAAAAQLAQAAGQYAMTGANSANSLPYTDPNSVPSSS